MNTSPLIPTFAAVLAWSLVTSSGAHAQDVDEGGQEDQPAFIEVGPLVGGGFFQIDTPNDPAGAITFLYGSAFSGGGLGLGASGVLRFKEEIGLEIDLLYSYASLAGFASSASGRRDITFSQHTLRLDVLARVSFALPNPELELSIGPELSVGIGAGWEEVVEGFQDQDAPPLEVRTNVALLPVFQLGVTTEVASVKLPVLARFGFNPFYPDTTVERFDGFVDANDPGTFIVDVDWYVLVMAGVRFPL